MTDLKKEREALVNEIELFIKESMKCFVVEVWADSYASIDSAFSYHIAKDEVFFLREQARQFWEFWQKRAELAKQEIVELTKQRDSFIKAHHIATDDVCKLSAEIIELKAKLAKYENNEVVVVPRVPSDAMIKALEGGVPYELVDSNYDADYAYKAMIEAGEI